MRIARLLSAAAILALPAPTAAHRGHDALSVVTVDARGGITVSHRFEAHDLEPALAEIAPDAQPSLDDPQAIAALAAYLGRHFALASERGAIVLALGKIDVGASQVRIAFTGRAARPPARLTVTSRLLTDIYPRQVNQVNVRFGKVVRTLTFTGDDTQTVDLGPSRAK